MMDSIKILIEELFSEITYLREDFFLKNAITSQFVEHLSQAHCMMFV